MRLIFFVISMNLGGTEKSLQNLISALPADCDIDVLLLEEKGELLNQFPKNVNLRVIDNRDKINEFIRIGCRRFAVNELKRGNIFSFLKNIIVFFLHKIKILSHPFYGIPYLIKEQTEGYDIAAAYAGPHDFITYYTLNFIKAKKKFQWIHFDITGINSKPNFGKHFYPAYDQIFCVSQNAKDTFVKVYPKLESKAKVFENLVSETYLKKQSGKDPGFDDGFEGFRILTVGRLTKVKGQYMIPRVVKRLAKDGYDFRWYLIGDGVLRKELEEKIEELEIRDRLILLGLRTNPYPYMSGCDLYVQTSLHEGYCLTIHEAKIFEKPVVTTAVLSASNLIENGEDGLIVPISEDGIYSGVRALLGDKKKRARFDRFLKDDKASRLQTLEEYFSEPK